MILREGLQHATEVARKARQHQKRRAPNTNVKSPSFLMVARPNKWDELFIPFLFL